MLVHEPERSRGHVRLHADLHARVVHVHVHVHVRAHVRAHGHECEDVGGHEHARELVILALLADVHLKAVLGVLAATAVAHAWGMGKGKLLNGAGEEVIRVRSGRAHCVAALVAMNARALNPHVHD